MKYFYFHGHPSFYNTRLQLPCHFLKSPSLITQSEKALFQNPLQCNILFSFHCSTDTSVEVHIVCIAPVNPLDQSLWEERFVYLVQGSISSASTSDWHGVGVHRHLLNEWMSSWHVFPSSVFPTQHFSLSTHSFQNPMTLEYTVPLIGTLFYLVDCYLFSTLWPTP